MNAVHELVSNPEQDILRSYLERQKYVYSIISWVGIVMQNVLFKISYISSLGKGKNPKSWRDQFKDFLEKFYFHSYMSSFKVYLVRHKPYLPRELMLIFKQKIYFIFQNKCYLIFNIPFISPNKCSVNVLIT